MAMSTILQDIWTFIFAAPSFFVARVLVEIPHLRDVMVPVGCTLTAAVVAWLVIPLILKSCYNESIKGTQVTPSAPFPYKASYWGALEDPLRCLIGFFSLSLAGYLIAPHIVSNYVLPAWKGAMMASFVLFLQRWKRSAVPHAFAVMVVNEADRINLAKLDTLFSKGIFGLGLLALAAAGGVSMLYISWITVAGEWVVLLADKDSNQNLYNGYYMRTSKLVKVGDFVKLRSGAEGEVTKIGVTKTLLLDAKKLPIVIPNRELFYVRTTTRANNLAARSNQCGVDAQNNVVVISNFALRNVQRMTNGSN